jgi:hypothetical protein
MRNRADNVLQHSKKTLQLERLLSEVRASGSIGMD